MKKVRHISVGLLMIPFFAACVFGQSENESAIGVAERIADRIIRDTSFKLQHVQQRMAVNVQVVDFKKALPHYHGGEAYAFVMLDSKKEGTLKLGMSFSQPFSLFINGRRVYENRSAVKFHFREEAYSLFSFNDTVSFDLRKGLNTVYLKSNSPIASSSYLGEITPADSPAQVFFVPVDGRYRNFTWPWCYATAGQLTAGALSDIFSGKEPMNVNIVRPAPDTVSVLRVCSKSAFRKDSYVDWNYANGLTQMSLLTLGEKSGLQKYPEYVKKCCDFVIDNLSEFESQYYARHDLRGPAYRFFRRSMLDDAGAPVLPYIQLVLMDQSNHPAAAGPYDSLIYSMTDFVVNDQSRLADGTFCRPEPEEWTVWADDLFMSVPLLVRMGKLTGKNEYYEEAIKQILNFNKYLFVPETGLYKHAWFSRSAKRSAVYWGRANGWAAWAVSEALFYVPKDVSGYAKIKKLFLDHLMGLIRIQGRDGMWHQVLNDPTSYEETSCSAMFILAISRAIRCGWLDRKYSANVNRAWKALEKEIDTEGIVKGICEGTGIGQTTGFYKSRKTNLNDPRGLGAVITAAVEVQTLNDLGIL